MAVGPPQSRTDDWANTVLGKLEQVGDIAREVNAHAVLDGGDFFHIKTPRRTSHALIQQVSAVHKGYPCPVYANVGNHDCKYGDIRFLDEAPLGVLMKTGVFKRCYDEHEAVFGRIHRPHPPMFSAPIPELVPAHELPSDPPLVRVVGVPYHGTEYDMERMTSLKKGDEDYLVAMVHCLASPDGGDMFGGEDIFKYADLIPLEPDVFLFGHWHKNQGVTEIASGKYVVNIGSLTRGALDQDNVERIPECAVLRFSNEGIGIKQRPLDVRPSEEVFDIEGRVRQQARAMTVDAFVDTVKATLKAKKRRSLLDDVRAMSDLLEPVRERTIEYIEEAGAN